MPAFGKVQAEPDRTPALALHLERHTGQGEKAVIGVEVAGAHRKLGGQDAPAHLQGLALPATQLPAGRFEPLHRQRFFALPHLKILQGAHIVADQIGAGGPSRQPQANGWGSGFEAKAGPHQMLMGIPQVQV